jgi:branched-chain amino acid transport system ATP-binding protein
MSGAGPASRAEPTRADGPSGGAELVVRDLRISYGRIEVVHGLALRAAPGRVTCLIGPNGAGKTTTIHGILAIVPPRAGEITLDGVPIAGLPTHRVVRLGVGVVPQGRRIFPTLTVLENLRMGAVTSPERWASREAVEEVFALFPVLAQLRRRLGGVLSGGEQQMLAMGRALIARPRLLLLDEPSMGLAPRMVERVYEALWRLRGRGMTIVLAEQNANAALALSDDAYVLESGRIDESGPSDELRRSTRVQEIYLGA